MKRIIILLLSFICYTVSSQTNTVGLITNSPEAYNGYTLFSPMGLGNTSTFLIDNCGYKVHEWNSSFQVALSTYLSDSGMLFRTKKTPDSGINSPSGGGGLEMLDQNSNVVWSYDYNTDIVRQHHDIEIMPNGNILILAWEKKTAQEAISQGRDPNLITNNELWPEHIIEIQPVGINEANIIWEWHVWDHLVQEFNPDLPNYGIVSEHPELFNLNYTGTSNNLEYSDWQHANSIDYNETLDQIMITSRRWNEIWIIDHSTNTEEAATSEGGNSGAGGNILYRWGNPLAYNRGDEDNRTLFFPHDAHWIQSGLPNENKIMIFNNGTNEIGSSVDIINPPLEFEGSTYILNNNIYGPESTYWSYSEPDNFFSRQISGAEQLPNGNILICSGNQGRIFEVDYNNFNIVWEYISPFTNNTGPVQQGSSPEDIANNVFRAQKFSPLFEGLSNLSLNPISPIELEPNPYNCQIYGCLNVIACNYDSSATEDNNTCTYPNDLCELENGDIGILNDNCECIENSSLIDEFSNNKSLLKIINILGKEITNTGFLLHVYDDGSVEKKYVIE